MPHPAWIARVGHLGKTLQKAGDFPRHHLWMFTELVKGRRDRR
ncbi:hypothetical protein [Streptomyces caelestis]